MELLHFFESCIPASLSKLVDPLLKTVGDHMLCAMNNLLLSHSSFIELPHYGGKNMGFFQGTLHTGVGLLVLCIVVGLPLP